MACSIKSRSYPPCISCGCMDASCCNGGKFKWPEVVGMKGQQAKSKIEKDVSFVTVILLAPGTIRIDNFCCNRVFVYLDDNGKVNQIPIIG
uniref:Proteinase inhibitor-like n=1 Tax=Cucumis melo TaxID=3656 RepID=A0A9I9CCF5_CUCME